MSGVTEVSLKVYGPGDPAWLVTIPECLQELEAVLSTVAAFAASASHRATMLNTGSSSDQAVFSWRQVLALSADQHDFEAVDAEHEVVPKARGLRSPLSSWCQTIMPAEAVWDCCPTDVRCSAQDSSQR